MHAVTISLILPAYNESDAIEQAIDEAVAALSLVADDYEVIVIDDGSVDRTVEKVEAKIEQNHRLRLIQHEVNRGYGAAIRSGFNAAKMASVVFTDADCQFDLTELDRFVLLSKRYDVVCGYRIDRKDTALRCLYSKVYNVLTRILLGTGVRDVDCAFKMFRSDVAKSLPISGDGFLVNSELLVQSRSQDRSVVEVGVSHRARTLGESTVSVRHIPKVLVGLTRYWWNEVQFPSAGSAKAGATHRDVAARASLPFWKSIGERTVWLQWIVMMVAAIFTLTNLGYPLIDRDETRYAEIAREMIATGNWILPQLNFETYYDKPPLLYWLCAFAFQMFGVSETSARWVPALASLGTLASTMFFGSRMFDRRTGLIAGVVLALSVGFAFNSRYLLLDGVLMLFVSLSLFSAFRAVQISKAKQKPRVAIGWWLFSAVCVGLAFLTKGPIAIVLWLPPIFAFTWLSRHHARPGWSHCGVAGCVIAAVAAPWFAMVHQQDSQFLMEFFYTHNASRFGGQFHARPIWYFVPVLLFAGHPWSFLTLPCIGFLFHRDEQTRLERPPALGFLLLWSVWTFVFFSLSGCKLPTYLLPAAPAFALMIGHYLNSILATDRCEKRALFSRYWSARLATMTTCLAAIGFVGFVIWTTGDASILSIVWGLMWVGLLIGTQWILGSRRQGRLAWGVATGTTFLFAVMVMHDNVPAYSRSKSILGESSRIANDLRMKPDAAIATIHHEFSEVPFYLEREDVKNFGSVNDPRIAEFIARNPCCLLFIEERVDPMNCEQHLPVGSRLIPLGHRGVARIFEVVSPAVANSPSHHEQPVQPSRYEDTSLRLRLVKHGTD